MDKHLKIMKMVFDDIAGHVSASGLNDRVADEMINVDWDHYNKMLNDDEPILHKRDYEIISKMLITDIKRMTSHDDEPTPLEIADAVAPVPDNGWEKYLKSASDGYVTQSSFKIHEFDGEGGFKTVSDDQITMSFTEDELRTIKHCLQNLAENYIQAGPGFVKGSDELQALLKRFDR